MPAKIARAAYAAMYGPSAGDKVRLADTDLVIEVEKDHTTYGEEVKFGGGKVIRDGMASHIDSVETGKLADLVLWSPAFFGVKPDLVIKMGIIAAAPMGDPNASIPTPQPVHYRPMFGAFGRALTESSVSFISRTALEIGVAETLGLAKPVLAVENTRGGISKADMVLNDATPAMEVDPETYEVRADGALLTCEPATELPMAQRYFLF